MIEKRRCNKMRPKWPRVDPTHPIPEGTAIIDPTIVGENGSVGGGKEGGITPSNNSGSNTPWAKGPANFQRVLAPYEGFEQKVLTFLVCLVAFVALIRSWLSSQSRAPV